MRFHVTVYQEVSLPYLSRNRHRTSRYFNLSALLIYRWIHPISTVGTGIPQMCSLETWKDPFMVVQNVPMVACLQNNSFCAWHSHIGILVLQKKFIKFSSILLEKVFFLRIFYHCAGRVTHPLNNNFSIIFSRYSVHGRGAELCPAVGQGDVGAAAWLLLGRLAGPLHPCHEALQQVGRRRRR